MEFEVKIYIHEEQIIICRYVSGWNKALFKNVLVCSDNSAQYPWSRNTRIYWKNWLMQNNRVWNTGPTPYKNFWFKESVGQHTKLSKKKWKRSENITRVHDHLNNQLLTDPNATLKTFHLWYVYGWTFVCAEIWNLSVGRFRREVYCPALVFSKIFHNIWAKVRTIKWVKDH